MDNVKRDSLLIVDDDTLNLMELTHIFQPFYKIYVAKDGISALKIAQRSLPDLILLDVIMPDKNGFEVINELKSSETTKNIPVIFITGIVDKDSEKAGLTAGAVDYIHKPFDASNVRTRVREAMAAGKVE
ncbi:MAG: response regulator [Treponema sp.]|nr:response regulator [Treponema sp.]